MADPDAVRQVRERARDREVSIWNSADGMGEVYAQLYATDAQALDARLNALVATVCAGDPRSTDQRRADALGALAAGADRLACRCDNPDCAAEGRPVSAVVIHVVAEQASVKGHGQAPAALLGGDGLIPAELVAELAKTAGLQPIPVPAGTEPGYRPSVKLAAFVRARDLTCRAPGCDRPATQCDLDHTIAFADGGATHAANLKCLCRLHHLLATFCGWRAQQLPDGTDYTKNVLSVPVTTFGFIKQHRYQSSPSSSGSAISSIASAIAASSNSTCTRFGSGPAQVVSIGSENAITSATNAVASSTRVGSSHAKPTSKCDPARTVQLADPHHTVRGSKSNTSSP